MLTSFSSRSMKSPAISGELRRTNSVVPSCQGSSGGRSSSLASSAGRMAWANGELKMTSRRRPTASGATSLRARSSNRVPIVWIGSGGTPGSTM